MKFSRTELSFFTLILLLTVVLRIPAVSFGLPVFTGADDDFVLIPALEIASLVQPATHFGLPDSTLFYSYGIVFRAVFEVLELTGNTLGTTPLEDYQTFHATWPLVTVRVLNIAWTLGALFLLYICGRKLFGRATASLAVLFASLSWILVEHTIHARPDVPSMVFVLLVLWFALRVHERGALRDYVWAGVGVGLAVATKYPLALTALMVAAAHGLKTGGVKDFIASKKLWAAAGVSLLVFSIATPLFWPLLPRAFEQIGWEARTSHPGADGLSFWGNLSFYITHVLNYGIGTLVSLLAVLGAGAMIYKERSKALLILIFPVALIIALSFHGLHWDRWMIPVIPFIALLAARGLTRVSHFKYIVVVIAIVAVAPATIRTARTTFSFMNEETRETAHAWVTENGLPNSNIARGPYTPEFHSTTFNEQLLPSLGTLNEEQLEARNIDYLISNTKQRERFLELPDTLDAFKVYYRNNLNHGTNIHTAQTDDALAHEQTVPISDWIIWRQPLPFNSERGSPIEIYAFSKRAKTHHAN